MIYYIRNDIDDLIGFKYNDEIYYYIKNGQEDIIGILDSNNNVVARYEYDSWGKVTSITGSNKEDVSTNQSHIANINPFRYRSYYYDKETNLYYLNSRYYNPVWGRFINEDSYISTGNGILGHNMYAYCNNNPIFYIDKNGHSIGIGIIIAGLILTTLFVGNSINKVKKAKKQIAKVQDNTDVPDKTDKLNEVMKYNASALQTAVQGQSPIQKMVTFKDFVTDGAIYDLKLTDDWNSTIKYENIIMEPQDIGNFHYGYIGRAIGIPKAILFGGAGVNQFSKYGLETIENCYAISFCDDPRNTIFIKMGAEKYDSEH